MEVVYTALFCHQDERGEISQMTSHEPDPAQKILLLILKRCRVALVLH